VKYSPLFILITGITIPVDAAVLSKNNMPSGEFNLTLNYTSETMANVSGGLKRGTILSGMGNVVLDYVANKSSEDLPRLFLRASGMLLHGESPSGKYIGDELAASNIDGYDSIRLYELWLQLSFWNGHGSLRFGSLLADAEFAFTDLGGLFLNSAFGWPTFISANTVNTGPAFFVTAPGIRFRLESTKSWYLQGGIYDGDSFDDPAGDGSTNAYGVHWQITPQQGYFSMFEMGHTNTQTSQNTAVPSLFKLGGWFHSAPFDDHLTGESHHGNYGLFLALEKSIWRNSHKEQELGLFFRSGLAPKDRSRYELAIDGGFNFFNPFTKMEGDVVGAGITFAKVSDHIRQAEEQVGILPVSDYELVFEVTGQFPATPWLTLQPNVQWIHHPGSSSALSNALVVSIRSTFTF
jgi:porin|tara:strand:- start:15 stop:1235 length:1221 start_codon:yes stop_codon:yes gene_type:complete